MLTIEEHLENGWTISRIDYVGSACKFPIVIVAEINVDIPAVSAPGTTVREALDTLRKLLHGFAPLESESKPATPYGTITTTPSTPVKVR